MDPQEITFFNPETGQRRILRPIRSMIRMVEALGYRPLTVDDGQRRDAAMGETHDGEA